MYDAKYSIEKETKNHISYFYTSPFGSGKIRYGKFLCIGGPLSGTVATKVDVGEAYTAFNSSGSRRKGEGLSQIWVFNELLKVPRAISTTMDKLI